MLFPVIAETCVHSVVCWPAAFKEYNHTSLLLTPSVAIDTRSFTLGIATAKSATSMLPCLNIM